MCSLVTDDEDVLRMAGDRGMWQDVLAISSTPHTSTTMYHPVSFLSQALTHEFSLSLGHIEACSALTGCGETRNGLRVAWPQRSRKIPISTGVYSPNSIARTRYLPVLRTGNQRRVRKPPSLGSQSEALAALSLVVATTPVIRDMMAS